MQLCALQDLVLDELNIKAIEPLTELGEVVTYDIRPNLSLLGPKYGKSLNAVRLALASLPAIDVARLVSAGSPVVLEVTDGHISLEPAEVLVDLRKRPGFAAAEGPNSTVVLDTDLTPELIHEGMARDFVRGVQDGRRNAGYQIDDRIEIRYDADPEVRQAIDQHIDYVKTETLATLHRRQYLDWSLGSARASDSWRAQEARRPATEPFAIRSKSAVIMSASHCRKSID